jgi:peroxiredoxin
LGVQIIPDFQPLEGLEIGDLTSDFELQTLTGETLELSDLRGQPVILNF